jgi:hypothetical protein
VAHSAQPNPAPTTVTGCDKALSVIYLVNVERLQPSAGKWLEVRILHYGRGRAWLAGVKERLCRVTIMADDRKVVCGRFGNDLSIDSNATVVGTIPTPDDDGSGVQLTGHH